MSDLKIGIQSLNDRNTITEKRFPEFDDSVALLHAIGGISASNNIRVLFEISAARTLFEHISWGKKYHRGDVEQAGILMGKYYRDTSTHNDIIWGDIIEVVPADSSLVCATFDNIDITTQAWKKMYEDAEGYSAQGMQILGWYHTHLDSINTRFSALDRRTQKKSFTFKYSFGVVLNPNQKKWSVFYGPESTECKGVLLLDNETQDKDENNHQITIKQVNGDSLLKEDGTVIHLDDDGNPLPIQQKMMDEDLEDVGCETLGSVIGQFLSGIGGLLSNKKKKRNGRHNLNGDKTDSNGKITTENRNVSKRLPTTPIKQRKTDSDIKRRKETPKIEILRASDDGKTVVECIYYTFSQNGDFKPHPNFGFIIEKEMIDEMLKMQPIDGMNKAWLDGKMLQKEGNVVLSIAFQEDANTKIIFGKDLAEGEKLKMIAMGLYRICGPNVQFIVIIDEISSQKIDVRVIHYSKGNVI